ncbi:MAG: GWxTD domain-containing protein [Acidobacteriota bacterium]
MSPVVWMFALLLLPLSSDLGEKYRDWLEREVRYIISSRERKEFKALETEAQRESFVQHFWRRRDPDPSTDINEFKEEHYRRIQFANQRFGNEGKPGWRTVRGRVYIVHGPPDDIRYSFGRVERVTIQNPTTVLSSAAGSTMVDVEIVTPESETWTYYHLEGARSFRTFFSIIFAKMDPHRLYEVERATKKIPPNAPINRRVQRDRVIKAFVTQKDYLRGDYRIAYAGEPRFRDVDDLIVSSFRSYSPEIDQFLLNEAQADLFRSTGEALERRLARERRIKEMVESRIFYSTFSIDVGVGFLRHLRGRVSIPLHARLNLPPAKPAKEIDFLAELVESATGRIVASVLDDWNPSQDSTGKSGVISYQSRLVAPPGLYRLRVMATDSGNGQLGLWEKEIHVPDLNRPGFGASELVLCERVLPRDEYRKWERASAAEGGWIGGHERPLAYDDLVFVPTVDRKFRRRQNLTTLLEVYNPTLQSGEPRVRIQSSWSRQGHRVMALPVRELDYITDKENKTIIYAFTIPLQGLDPGFYDFAVQVTDGPSGQIVRKTAPFRIR